MTTRSSLRIGRPLWIVALALAMPLCWGSQARSQEPPEWKLLEGFVHRYFRGQPDYKDGDLISRGHVTQLLGHLAKMGWKVPDRNKILKDSIDDNHVMVQQFTSPKGIEFMRKVNKDPLIYSKLDRISMKRGGPQLIRDVVRIKNGDRFAAKNPPQGAPALVDMLPRVHRSKKQSIQDYDKPTGAIYTKKDLLKRLKASYDKGKKL